LAEKRMFSKQIIDSDAFLEMPSSTQALYFHLGMRADDDGFLNNPKKIQRMANCSDDDLRILFARHFVIPFESGVCVIKHWRIHNLIQKDRYKPTVYQEEKALLDVKDNKAYTLCIQDGNTLIPQVRLGKDRLDKVRLEEGIADEPQSEDKPPRTPPKRFTPPTIEEVSAYCQERGNTIDPEHFHSYYESVGWMRGKSKMKDWKGTVRTWEKNDAQRSQPVQQRTKRVTAQQYTQRTYDEIDPNAWAAKMMQEAGKSDG
jgi:hypothetical protein